MTTHRRRPAALTKSTRRVLLTALELGVNREGAAQIAGLRPGTLARWMARAAEPWASFAIEVHQAEARAEVAAVDAVIRGSKTDPQLAVWWLERRHPERWGQSPAKAGVPASAAASEE